VAGIVVGEWFLGTAGFRGAARRLPVGFFDQEFAQFKGFFSQTQRPVVVFGVVFEEVGIFLPDHGGAGTAGQDNGRFVGK
jgi:hypothetical protein